MGALGDGQASDEYTVSICAKDASGPYHKQLKSHLVRSCKINNIPYKVKMVFISLLVQMLQAAFMLVRISDMVYIGAGIESSHAMERTHIDSVKQQEIPICIYLYHAN